MKIRDIIARLFPRAMNFSSNGFVFEPFKWILIFKTHFFSMMKKIEPSEIGKNPDLIASELMFTKFWLFWFIHKLPSSPSLVPFFQPFIEAQKEMAQSDILVCGKCHSVYHFMDLFNEHKANNCKRTSAFNDCVSIHNGVRLAASN